MEVTLPPPLYAPRLCVQDEMGGLIMSYSFRCVGVFFTSCFPAPLDLKTVCNELGSVKVKSHEIGVMLGLPQHKLLEFQKGDNPLPAIADFWLRGNVEGAEVSWKSIARALASEFVGEPALAKEISQKYCQVEESQKGIT